MNNVTLKGKWTVNSLIIPWFNQVWIILWNSFKKYRRKALSGHLMGVLSIKSILCSIVSVNPKLESDLLTTWGNCLNKVRSLSFCIVDNLDNQFPLSKHYAVLYHLSCHSDQLIFCYLHGLDFGGPITLAGLKDSYHQNLYVISVSFGEIWHRYLNSVFLNWCNAILNPGHQVPIFWTYSYFLLFFLEKFLYFMLSNNWYLF